MAVENFQRVAEALKKIGYAHVTLDLQGYRRGSVNEVIQFAGGRKGWLAVEKQQPV